MSNIIQHKFSNERRNKNNFQECLETAYNEDLRGRKAIDRAKEIYGMLGEIV